MIETRLSKKRKLNETEVTEQVEEIPDLFMNSLIEIIRNKSDNKLHMKNYIESNSESESNESETFSENDENNDDFYEYLLDLLDGYDDNGINKEKLSVIKQKFKNLIKIIKNDTPNLMDIVNSELSDRDKVTVLELWHIYNDIDDKFQKSMLKKTINEYIRTYDINKDESYIESKLIELDNSRLPTKKMIINSKLTSDDKIKALKIFDNYTKTRPYDIDEQKKKLYDFIQQNSLSSTHELDIVEEEEKKLRKHLYEKKTLKARIMSLNTTEKNKQVMYEKYVRYQGMPPDDADAIKIYETLDFLCDYPWGNNDKLPISINTHSSKDLRNYLIEQRENIDSNVSYMDDIKSEMLDLVSCIMINPDMPIKAISLCGPAGTGKTKIITEALAKPLGRQLGVISLGGERDSTIITGSQGVWIGAESGRIVELVKQYGAENLIIYFDELDKIDNSTSNALAGALTRLVDPTQNHMFHDKRYYGIDFDISKILFVFSYNDSSKVDSILGDRIKEYKIKKYSIDQKNNIAIKHIIPEIEKNLRFQNGDVLISNDVLKYIQYKDKSNENGMRQFIRNLENIYKKLNTCINIMGGESVDKLKLPYKIDPSKLKFPFNVTTEVVNEFIKDKYEPWMALYS